MLFALPHVDGFSGQAWLNFQPARFRLSNWTAPPEWLSLSVSDLGQSLDDYVATNRPAEEQWLAAVRATRTTEVRLPDRPLLTNSTVKVQGLPGRSVAFSPPLPTIFTNDVLASTVVTIAVNGDGIVESAAVARESGSKGVDAHALQLARAFMFHPASKTARNASPAFGQLIFTWNTAPATNTAAVPTASATPDA
jgi:TonB family protein